MIYIIDKPSRAIAVSHVVMGLPVGMSVEVKEYKPRRSTAQNRCMWKWYSELAKHTGHEAETLHEMMKVRVLGTRMVEVGDKTYEVPNSTTKLGVKEMARFLEAIEALGRQLDCPLSRDDEYNLAMGRMRE